MAGIGGAGVVALIFLMLILFSIGSVIFYFVRRCRYTRLGLPVPRLKKRHLVLLYSPIIVLILLSALLFWSVKANEKSEYERNKKTYFTLEKDTPFGEIILPKGTHISKFFPSDDKNNAAPDLNDVNGIQFPHPVQINGLSVLMIFPATGVIRLAEEYRFINGHGETVTCPKKRHFIVELNNTELVQQYQNKNLPIPPTTFKPSLWTFNDCTITFDYPSSVPHWENGKLIQDD